jgi:hypothetical protein
VRQFAAVPAAGVTPDLDPPSRLDGLADAEYLVEFASRQRTIDRRDRAQHLGVQIDLVEGDSVMDTIIKLLSHRAHLRR